MWLINANTLKLEEFIEPVAGSYAILSHTWEEEEVSFEQFRTHGSSASDPVRHQKGFIKIVKTCKIASQRGVSHVWVDTCCINKSSSAELTEAINSMFKWYRRAAFCIAFISDLEKPLDTEDSASHFERHFPRCRWLTRGWTLQELIAPQHVRFYDASWSFRGSKSEFTTFLSKETGIDEEILKVPTNLPIVPLARRMSWASRRQTTRVEDRAYSLLGIFDVNMPLLYGEGEKAFIRLQDEIIKESCDLSLFAWRQQTSYPSYRGIFANSPAEFIDCRSLINRNKGNILSSDIVTTNKGLRTDVALLDAPGYTGDYIWHLDCGERMEWRIGIFLVQTKDGLVRDKPYQIFRAFEPNLSPSGTVYIRKTVPALDLIPISQRFSRAIKLRVIAGPVPIKLHSVAPAILWHKPRCLFLCPGEGGLNSLLRFELQSAGKLRPVIVACSTMKDKPFCAVMAQQANSAHFWAELENVMCNTDISIFTTPAWASRWDSLSNRDHTVSSRNLRFGLKTYVTVSAALTMERFGEDGASFNMFVLRVSARQLK
jgi:hypothetical protein